MKYILSIYRAKNNRKSLKQQMIVCFALCIAFSLLMLPLVTRQSQSAAGITFSFTLDKSYATSAAAYQPDGTLVRTLWNRRQYNAGTHTEIWNGLDDNGNAVPPGNYQIKLISHNVEYVWEGVIGNTSAEFTGTSVHRSLHQPTGLAISGNNAFYSSGFNEGQSGMHRFNTADPQRQNDLLLADYKSSFDFVATDGTWAYYANSGNPWDYGHFVVAVDVSNNTLATFANGTPQCSVYNPYDKRCQWTSTIDRGGSAATSANPPTGIAVQRNGNLLAVAHGGANQVRLFHKRDGNLLRTISVTNPTSISFAPNGDLWVVGTVSGARKVRRYTNLNTTPTAATTLNGLVEPLAVAVHPIDFDTVLIADGGASQQIKCFTNTGELRWTMGQAGGYASGPDVTTDKFWFRTEGPVKTFLAVEDNGSFWINDRGNRRMLRFSSTRQYLDQIMFLPASRVAAADINNPQRVFNGFQEFEVDYTKPLAPTNDSWRLVRNWHYNNDFKDYLEHDGVHLPGLSSVLTMSNGRTYALSVDLSNYDDKTLYELTNNGLRRTSITFRDAYFEGTTLEPDGSLQYQQQGNGVVTFFKKPLSGFDSNGDPQWGAAQILASAPVGINDPYYHIGAFPARTRLTSSDVVVSFDPSSKGNPGFHLGGVKRGSNKWLWRASPTGWLDFLGKYQSQDVDNSTQYAGNVSVVSGRNIVYGFHGEFWKHQASGNVGQANQWMHFWDNGLFVGQFGQEWYYDHPAFVGGGAVAGSAGNAFSPTLVKVNGQTYLYHNDESSHSGLHRWHLKGIGEIKEFAGTGALGSSITLTNGGASPTPSPTPGNGAGLTGEYFDNADLTGLRTTRVDPTVNFNWGTGAPTGTALTNSDTFSVRWTGQVQAPVSGNYTFTTTSDDGIRLWVNNQQIINNWTDHGPTDNSGNISLTAGERYAVRMEYYENTGGTTAKLFWSFPGQARQIVPQSTLYPAQTASVVPVIAVDSGGGGAGRFAADSYFGNINGDFPGQTYSINNVVDISGAVNPAPASVYQSERWGEPSFVYTLAGLRPDGVTPNLTPGQSYLVRLHFAENYVTGVGQRQFNVSINEQTALTNFDIYAAAGAQNKAVIREFIATAQARGNIGIITLNFAQGAAQNPVVQAIEVLPTSTNTLLY